METQAQDPEAVEHDRADHVEEGEVIHGRIAYQNGREGQYEAVEHNHEHLEDLKPVHEAEGARLDDVQDSHDDEIHGQKLRVGALLDALSPNPDKDQAHNDGEGQIPLTYLTSALETAEVEGPGPVLVFADGPIREADFLAGVDVVVCGHGDDWLMILASGLNDLKKENVSLVVASLSENEL